MGVLLIYSNLKEINMMKVIIALCLIIGSFTAADELDADVSMREGEQLDRAEPYKCPYCPKKEPYCHGYCSYEYESCEGKCKKCPPKYSSKVSTSDRLSAIASELFKIEFGSDSSQTVSIHNLFNIGTTADITLTTTDNNFQFTVNGQNDANQLFTGTLISILASVDGFICTLTTSQAGPFFLSPIYKEKKGWREIIGCNITRQ